MKALWREVGFQCRYAVPLWLLSMLTDWWPNNRITLRVRGWLYRPFCKRCGRNLQLASGVRWINPHNLEIGNDVYMAYDVWVNGLGGVRIEDEVIIAPYVVIASSNHVRKNRSFRFGGSVVAPIRIGRGSWLGSHVTVTAGAVVGEGSVVGANSVVTKEIPPDTFAAGLPAKPIRPVTDTDSGVMSRSGFSTSA